MTRLLEPALLACLLAPAGLGAQGVPRCPAPRPGTVAVVAVDGHVTPLTGAQLGGGIRQTVQTLDHDGKPARYEGVPLRALLEHAGWPAGALLGRQELASLVVVEAADEYRATFALPELDPDWTDRVVLLADRRDGQPLDADTGPFQLIVPGEKRHGRWVRQVTCVRLQRL